MRDIDSGRVLPDIVEPDEVRPDWMTLTDGDLAQHADWLRRTYGRVVERGPSARDAYWRARGEYIVEVWLQLERQKNYAAQERFDWYAKWSFDVLSQVPVPDRVRCSPSTDALVSMVGDWSGGSEGIDDW